MDKFIDANCVSCGAKFKSKINYEKGKMYCFVDCPTCRKNKVRYLSSVEVYSEIYEKSKDNGGE